jgi:hypothetical protein
MKLVLLLVLHVQIVQKVKDKSDKLCKFGLFLKTILLLNIMVGWRAVADENMMTDSNFPAIYTV